MKKLFNTALIIAMCLLIIPTVVDAKTLNVWYSNDDRIGYASNRNIWSLNYYGGLEDSDFNDYLNHGRNQWSNAGIPTYGADDRSSAIIWVYGGSRDDLEQLEPALANYSALADVSATHVGTHTYNGQTKHNYRITGVKVYVPKQPFYYLWGAKNYRSAFTHELGHALGWFGHSSGSDVMNSSGYSRDELTDRDKAHLIQNY